VARRIDAGVERVRPATVGLVHDERFGWVRDTKVRWTGAVSMSSRRGTRTGSRSNVERSTSIVPSVEPSLTTTTSCRGYRSASSERTLSTMTASSL
jgi:hypothetical protein